MKQLNLALTILAVIVLVLTISLLIWMRQRADTELERSVENAGDSFDRRELLHGPGGDTLIHFAEAETLASRVLESPYIANLVLTKLTGDGREVPVVPFTLLADEGPDWKEKLAAQARGTASRRQLPLGPGEPWGYLYLELDRSSLQSMTWAIAAVGLAIVLMLILLVARLWSQQTSLVRTYIELNERRNELIRVERLALAGQLAAGLLHDLRKPVLNIQHSLGDMTEALGDFAPAAAPLQDLQRNTRLFFQILAESQIERFVQSDRVGEEYLDIVPMLDFSLSLVRYERRGVEVVRREADNLPPVLAQPFRLVQLFSNLILNAYQAMGGKGILTIDAAAIQGGVEVRLTDTGPGIAPEHLPHIFEPFYTTKPQGEGTGLGLSICRMIAEDMKGRLHVETRSGEGAVFIVWLPGEDENV